MIFLYDFSKVVKPKGKGGQNAEIILLTIRCFKKFCQLTRSKHGNDVREYFIDVEYKLNKYKNYIIEGLSDKIDAVKKGRKPKINSEKAIIYIFRTADSPENSLYKIGRTKDYNLINHHYQKILIYYFILKQMMQ